MSIKTSIQLQNQMTPILESINKSLNYTLSTIGDIENSSQGMFNTSSLAKAREETAKLTVELNKIERETHDNEKAQEKHNREIKEGSSLLGSMGKKALAVGAAFASITTVKKFQETSDELAQINARLSLMKSESETIEGLHEAMFKSAQSSRANYLTVADSVAKLGMQAGDAFNNTDEIIAFTEQLNKNFVLSGTSAQGMESAMYQLNQAMAMGILRGEEFNALNENAPSVIKAIGDYMGVAKGEVRKLAAEGKITADIVKNALFKSAEETNRAFESMPMTFSQISVQMKNTFIRNMQPALQMLNDLANSQSFKVFMENATQALAIVAQVLSQVVSIGISGFNLMVQNGGGVIAVLQGLTTAMFAWWVITTLQKINLEKLGKIFSMQNLGILLIAAALSILFYQTMKWIESVGGIQVAWAIFFNKLKTGLENTHTNIVKFEVFVNKVFMDIEDAGTRMAMKINDAITQMAINGIKSIQNLVNSTIDNFNTLIGFINNIPGVDIDLIEHTDLGNGIIKHLEETNRANDLVREQRLKDNEATRISNQKYLEDLQSKYKAAQNERNKEVEKVRTEAKNKKLKLDLDLEDNNLSSMAQSLEDISKDTKDIKDEIAWDNNNLSGLRDLMQSRAITELSKDIKLEVYNEFSGNVSSEVDIDTLKNEVTSGIIRDFEIAVNGGV